VGGAPGGRVGTGHLDGGHVWPHPQGGLRHDGVKRAGDGTLVRGSLSLDIQQNRLRLIVQNIQSSKRKAV
jgi:hypothetical protein